MKTWTRLALYGAALAAAFGAAFGIGRIAVPDAVVESWTRQGQTSEHGGGNDEMNAHDEDRNGSAGTGGHDHAPNGGPPPEGIRPASDPEYPVGSAVRLAADHMPGMDGAAATITGAFATTTYAVTYTPTDGGDPVVDHKWVVHEELDAPGAAPLDDGTPVVLQADHMPGMQGADGVIAGSTDETVYMVDVAADGMEMTDHKWVVESEIVPAE